MQTTGKFASMFLNNRMDMFFEPLGLGQGHTCRTIYTVQFCLLCQVARDKSHCVNQLFIIIFSGKSCKSKWRLLLLERKFCKIEIQMEGTSTGQMNNTPSICYMQQAWAYHSVYPPEVYHRKHHSHTQTLLSPAYHAFWDTLEIEARRNFQILQLFQCFRSSQSCGLKSHGIPGAPVPLYSCES